MQTLLKSIRGLFFPPLTQFSASQLSVSLVFSLSRLARAGPGTAELRQILCGLLATGSGPGCGLTPVARLIMGPDQINKHNNIIINEFSLLRWTITYHKMCIFSNRYSFFYFFVMCVCASYINQNFAISSSNSMKNVLYLNLLKTKRILFQIT